jgi:hypothetical protein
MIDEFNGHFFNICTICTICACSASRTTCPYSVHACICILQFGEAMSKKMLRPFSPVHPLNAQVIMCHVIRPIVPCKEILKFAALTQSCYHLPFDSIGHWYTVDERPVLLL